ncbi:MAG: SH3 domain-containing protein [Chloroflexota bacterium]
MPRPMTVVAVLVCLFVAGTVTAQTEDYIRQCAAVANAAVASVQLECDAQPGETACYGSIPAGVTGTNAVEETFNRPGDTVSLADVATLTGGAANIEQGAFGIMRLTPRINYSDASLAMYIFGDVTLENTGDAALNVPTKLIPVTFADGANIRSVPDVNGEQTGVVFAGNLVRATGMIESGAWVRIVDEAGAVGWVNATLFDSDDLTGLTVVDPANDSAYGPMQAFEVATSDTPDDCLLIPPNGVLIQTPDVAETARMQINGVEARFPQAATLFVSTRGDDLLVDVLEGEVIVGAVIAAGERGVISDESITVDGYPLLVYNTLVNLPINRLPREIFLTLDFSTIVRDPQPEPLAGIELDDICTIAAGTLPANLREEPIPGARVRYVMPPGASANPVARAGGGDGALWFQLAYNVWVSSDAVFAAGSCGTLPFFGYVP